MLLISEAHFFEETAPVHASQSQTTRSQGAFRVLFHQATEWGRAYFSPSLGLELMDNSAAGRPG